MKTLFYTFLMVIGFGSATFAQEKSKKVLQLLSTDKRLLGASYGFESIPRFLLIGPDGKIINIQMPNPSNPEFEEIIKRETQGL